MFSLEHQAFLAAPTRGKTVTIATNTGTPAMAIKWIGSGMTATVAVAAGGDFAFTTDGSTADTTVNTTGALDCSTPGATTDTFGEIEALINASSNWQARLIGALRDDSTDNSIYTLAATANCCLPSGVEVNFDPATAVGSDAGKVGVSLCITADKFYGKKGWRKHCEEGFIASLFYVTYNLTYASGTTYIDVYFCDDVAKTDTLVARFPAGATTVAKEIGNIAAACIQAPAGQRIIVRPTAAAAFTAGYGTITGKAWCPTNIIYD